MRTRPLAVALFVPILAVWPLLGDDAPRPPEADALIVTDARGKEHKVSKYKFTAGTRRLGWLGSGQDKGPEALVIRDAAKFGFADGVVLYVPLSQARSVTFDNKKETMTVRAAVSDVEGDDVLLTGSTEYNQINKLTLEAELDKGEAGVAELTFQGGAPRGILGIRFPKAKAPAADKKIRPAVVQSMDKGVKRADKVADLQPLYRFGSGQEQLGSVLLFKKTLKLDVAKIKKVVAGEASGVDVIWQVTQKGEEDELSLTVLKTATIDGKQGTLVGLVGKAAGGYRFFPTGRITQIDFDSTELPGEKEKPKEKIKADTE